jgi:TRAP-type C4-dicarboxylate transport system, small permease component
MRHAGRILDLTEKSIIIFLLSFMTLMNFSNVASRYVLAQSISASEELTLIAFTWVSMIGIAAAYRKGTHLGMGLLSEYLPPKYFFGFSMFSTLCSLVFISVLFVYSIFLIQQQILLNARTPALSLPAWLESGAIPVACVFMFIRALQFGVDESVRLRTAAKEMEAN